MADNQLAARASWDPDLLHNELRDLKFADFNLDLIGFQPDRLAEILAGLGSSGLTDPDSIPEAPDQPVTRRGDIWVLGDHRVGCGDSTNATDVAPVLAGSQPHLMVADPPYGVSYDPSWRARRGLAAGKLALGKVLNDDRADWREAYSLFPGMSPISGTRRCTATSSPLVWPPAGFSCVLRSSGPSSTSP